MCALTCVLSYVCSYVCSHMCTLTCVLSYVCFHMCALICVLAYVCSHKCSDMSVLMCSHMSAPMCSHLCVLIIITATSLVSFCPPTLFGVSCRDNAFSTCLLFLMSGNHIWDSTGKYLNNLCLPGTRGGDACWYRVCFQWGSVTVCQCVYRTTYSS